LTGRENVYINGAILGMSKKEIDRKFDEIVSFADIGDFIDSPVKHYSSGMYVRLGFAVAIHCEPDILLVDEVLAVGDASFQVKCYLKMKSLRDAGTTIILVAHDINTIQRVSHRGLYLEKGKAISLGATPDVVSIYYQNMHVVSNVEPQGKTGPAKIINVEILNEYNQPASSFKSGDDIIIRLHFAVSHSLENPTFSISLKSSDELVYTGCSSFYDGLHIGQISGTGYIDLLLKNPLLGPGTYGVNAGIWDKEFFSAYDWQWNYARLSITSEKKMLGRFGLTHSWKLNISSNQIITKSAGMTDGLG